MIRTNINLCDLYRNYCMEGVLLKLCQKNSMLFNYRHEYKES